MVYSEHRGANMRYSYSFGKKSSKILLGTAYFGDTISKKDAFEIMDKYCDMGGTHIDTARLYAGGESETVIGEWLKDRKPENMLVSTKGGYPAVDASVTSRLTECEIRRDLEASLKALKTDCIEFYWLHCDDENVPACDVIEIMNIFVKEGKIKKFGASNWQSARIGEANKYAAENDLQGFSASQIRFNPAYNVTERSWLVGMDKNEFEWYKKAEMPVVAYSSQAKGFFSKMAAYGESALSEKAKLRYMCKENLRRLEIIKELSKKYECSVAAAVCGCLCSFDLPDVFPIIGGSSIEQIEDSMNGADVVINAKELEELFGFI